MLEEALREKDLLNNSWLGEGVRGCGRSVRVCVLLV